MNLKTLYNKVENFRTYVDAYSVKHKITVDEALSHKTVQSVSEMYLGEVDDGTAIQSRMPERKCDS